MTNAPSPPDAPSNASQALPTEGSQIALAWAVFGALVVCVLILMAIANTLLP